MGNEKSILLSRTFWFNLLSMIVGVLTVVSQNELVADHPTWVAGILSAISAINIALRFVTKVPVNLPKWLGGDG